MLTKITYQSHLPFSAACVLYWWDLFVHRSINHSRHFKFEHNIFKYILNHSVNLFFSHTSLFGRALVFLVYSLMNIYFLFHFPTHYFILDIKYCPIASKISHNLHKNISNQSVNSLFSHTSPFHRALYLNFIFYQDHFMVHDSTQARVSKRVENYKSSE
jgi:hypothetical protein